MPRSTLQEYQERQVTAFVLGRNNLAREDANVLPGRGITVVQGQREVVLCHDQARQSVAAVNTVHAHSVAAT